MKEACRHRERGAIKTLRWILCLALWPVMAVYADEFAPAKPMPSVSLGNEQLVNRVAFGSCFVQRSDDEILNTIAATRADTFLFIGDNVYAEDESDDPELMSLREAYGQLAESDAFQNLRNTMPLLVTWDDHDFGLNDAGGDWLRKETSETLFEYVWAVPEDDVRRSRPGIYYEKTVGPEGRRVQFVVLDTRFFRSPIRRAKTRVPHGRYEQHWGDHDMLGAAQWQWLEEVLQKSADVRIIATSIQLVAAGHAWEAWHVMPEERSRFYDLLSRVKPNGVVLISGDRHASAIYKETENVPYPIWELTASSLNRPLIDMVKNIVIEPGPKRMGEPFYGANFGIIDIDWAQQQLLLQVRDNKDRVVRAETVNLGDLQPPSKDD